MNKEFITDKSLQSIGNHGLITKTISLILLVLSLVLAKVTQMWLLIPFSLILPAIVFHVSEYRSYRKWRKRITETESAATEISRTSRTSTLEEKPCGVVEFC